ncbi:Serine/threonine-protein phosphatase 7 long form [Glycine soja]
MLVFHMEKEQWLVLLGAIVLGCNGCFQEEKVALLDFKATYADRKLRMRRAIPTYKGIEQPSTEIIPLLQQSGLYTTIKLCKIKINGGIINVFVERWRPETHIFHFTCGEATITLQDVSVLLGLPMDGNPLIGSTNIDGIDMREQYLGVRPNANALTDGNTLKLSWLASQFANIQDYMDDEEHLKMFARAWILRFIGGVLLVDKSSKRVPMRYLQFLVAFEECNTYVWGAATLSYLYREMCNATDYNVQSIGGYLLLIQLWAWERCPKLVPSIVPPQQQNNPLGYRWLQNRNPHMASDSVEHYRFKLDTMKRGEFLWVPYSKEVQALLSHLCFAGSAIWRRVVPMICFNVVECHQPDRVMRQFGLQQPIPGPPLQPSNIHGLTLKGKSGHNWRRLLQPALNEWNCHYERRFQETPPQVGSLSVNSEYMKWFRCKTKLNNAVHVVPIWEKGVKFGRFGAVLDKMTFFAEEEDRIIEAREEAPPSVPQFESQQFDMLARSVETQGLGRRRESVDAEAHVIPAMPERQHGMYYTPDQFTQEPSQMSPLYPYPYQSETSSDAYFMGTQPPLQPGYVMTDLFGSPSPAGTPSFTHGCQISTPNAPMALHGLLMKGGAIGEGIQIDKLGDGSSLQSISFLSRVDLGLPFIRLKLGSGTSVHDASDGGIASSFPKGHHDGE